MALMLEQLDVQPGHRVLEIGAGTGYNAALLAHLAGGSGEVTTLDLDDDIVAAAREHLAACGYGRVRVVQADGGNGWPPGAPYDRIILTVGAWDIAPAWAGQLSPRGRLVLPLALRAGIQYSIAFEQAGDHLDSVSVLPCGFMRLRGAFAGPETIVPLGRRTGMLAESDPGPPTRKTWSPCWPSRATPSAPGSGSRSTDLYGGLGLWLAAREPGLGRLSAFGVRRPPGPAAAAGRPGMGMVASAHGCAALVPMSDPGGTDPAGLRTPFDLGACPFGTEGAELAARLAGHVRDWDAAGRPSLAGLRVSAYPAGASAARCAAGDRHRQAAHPAGAGLAGCRAQPGLTPISGLMPVSPGWRRGPAHRAAGRGPARRGRRPARPLEPARPAVQSAQRIPMKLPMPA